MPGLMYYHVVRREQLGRDTVTGRRAVADRGRTCGLVHFLGFDNASTSGLPHIALLMAHGDRYVWPESIVNNEFYELES